MTFRCDYVFYAHLVITGSHFDSWRVVSHNSLGSSLTAAHHFCRPPGSFVHDSLGWLHISLSESEITTNLSLEVGKAVMSEDNEILSEVIKLVILRLLKNRPHVSQYKTEPGRYGPYLILRFRPRPHVLSPLSWTKKKKALGVRKA